MSKQSPVGWAPLSRSRLWAQTESEWVLLLVNINESWWVLMRVSINEKAATCGLSSTLSLFYPDSELRLRVGEY